MNTSSCRFTIFYLKLPDHRISLSTILGITAITSTLLNSLVLFSIWKTPSLHKPSYILIANLALTDFLNGTLVQPLAILFNVTILMNWKSMFCQVWLGTVAIGYWLGAISVYTVTITSVDRFLAVKLNNRYRSTVTSRRTASVIICGWIGIGLVAFSTILLPNFSISSKIVIAAVYLAVLLTILTVCSFMAFYYLKKMSSSVSASNTNTSHEAATPGHQNINVNKYRRSLNTMLLVILCMFLFYLPLVASGIVGEVTMKAGQEFGTDSSSLLAYKLLIKAEMISLIYSSVNPVLYLWRIQDLRRAVFLRLRIIFRRQIPGNQGQQVQP